MLRVHEGLPARQLPMIVPVPEPAPQVAEERREQRLPGNRVDDFIGNILQSILGN